MARTLVLAAAQDPLLPWVDLAQIVGAIATAAGVVIALWFSIRGGIRQRRADHRGQAAGVSVTVEDREGGRVALLLNASGGPVFDVVVGAGYLADGRPRFLRGWEHNRVVAQVPPGAYLLADPRGLETRVPGPDGDREDTSPEAKRGVTITFCDANGVAWQRDARGRLSETRSDVFAERGLAAPVAWDTVRADPA